MVIIIPVCPGKDRKYFSLSFNPLPDIPILGSSNSSANKDIMSKYGQMGILLSD